jgi:hypothetical protein
MAVTKLQAVGQLIDGAIRAEETGDYACAITLAGAAEGAMPEPDGKHLFKVTRDTFIGYAEEGLAPMTEKQVVSMLNGERDWLKHYNSNQPKEIELKGGFQAVLRAVSKFYAVYGLEAETPTMARYFEAARRFDPHDG